jgi:hypothetical protein
MAIFIACNLANQALSGASREGRRRRAAMIDAYCNVNAFCMTGDFAEMGDPGCKFRRTFEDYLQNGSAHAESSHKGS